MITITTTRYPFASIRQETTVRLFGLVLYRWQQREENKHPTATEQA